MSEAGSKARIARYRANGNDSMADKELAFYEANYKAPKPEPTLSKKSKKPK